MFVSRDFHLGIRRQGNAELAPMDVIIRRSFTAPLVEDTVRPPDDDNSLWKVQNASYRQLGCKFVVSRLGDRIIRRPEVQIGSSGEYERTRISG
jgi:hypothetical protein